jgi:tetratricopeptide (TPR) repeat protein
MRRSVNVENNRLRTKECRLQGSFSVCLLRRIRATLLVFLSVVAVYGVGFVPATFSEADEVAELTERLSKDPSNVGLLKQRAALLRSEQRFSDALNDLDRARLLDPNDHEIRVQRGITLSALRRDREAESEFDSYLKLETAQSRAIALAERGHIRARTGRPELAITDFTDAIAIRPALDLYLARGTVQESTGQLGAAAAGYQDGILRLGRAIQLLTALIRVQVQQGEFQSALTLINNELPRTPIKTLWLLSRAEVLSAMGQAAQAQLELNAALEDANQALQKRPTAIHLLSRAKVLTALGRHEDAREDLLICLQIAPRFAECRQLLN